MSDKRVDESWKEQAELEKHTAPAAKESNGADETTQASQPEATQNPQFEQFISSLAMEALIAFGDMPHPATQQIHKDLGQAKYMIDLLEVLEKKTQGNLTAPEQQLFSDALYQLRMRFLQATQEAPAAEAEDPS